MQQKRAFQQDSRSEKSNVSLLPLTSWQISTQCIQQETCQFIFPASQFYFLGDVLKAIVKSVLASASYCQHPIENNFYSVDCL